VTLKNSVALPTREGMWDALAEYARWSPSPHNVQPWQLRVRSEIEADLFYVPARLLPAEDPIGRFLMVALGIFVENLAVAARARGFDVEPEYADVPVLDSTSSSPSLFARLRLVPSADGDDFDPELIVRRRTSRVAYNGRVVPEPVLAELAEICSPYGNRLVSSSDSELISWVLALNRDALFEDMTNAKTRREVGSWLRFSEREAARRKDGFSPACLGFPGWLLYLFFHYRGFFELPGLRHAVRRLYFRTMRGTSTIVWLVGPFDGPEDWVRSGRLLARLWLALTAAGLYLHPFGSIITNEPANERLRARVEHDPAQGTLWFIMRVGASGEPPRSARLPRDDILLR
jgi:hypothetical protein